MQFGDIRIARMTLIGPRMQSNAVGPKLQESLGKRTHLRIIAAARIAQLPGRRSVTLLLLTEQTVVVSEEKLTGRPEDAVALMVSGEALIGFALSGPNVMAWRGNVTAKLWSILC